jgi:hypothetical protein
VDYVILRKATLNQGEGNKYLSFLPLYPSFDFINFMNIKPIRLITRQSIRHRPSMNLQNTFTSSAHFNMPLVVPGITNNGDGASKTEDWTNKLVGKKLGSTSDATVCYKLSVLFLEDLY